ncbi:hypothetical protein [Pseudarthrobacter sp. C4D7]|nr:hypothetical protein [Pseudarthrobacter sp. C4D7]
MSQRQELIIGAVAPGWSGIGGTGTETFGTTNATGQAALYA